MTRYYSEIKLALIIYFSLIFNQYFKIMLVFSTNENEKTKCFVSSQIWKIYILCSNLKMKI